MVNSNTHKHATITQRNKMNIIVNEPEVITEMLKDESKIKEYANYVIFDLKSKREAWIETFNPDVPMSRAVEAKMYRWFQKEEVKKWMEKLNKSLEIDWIDKRVDSLQHLYKLGTDSENAEKIQIDALDKFLTHLNKVENKITLEHTGAQQVSIIQIVQDKLTQITKGATIQPDYVEAQIEDNTDG